MNKKELRNILEFEINSLENTLSSLNANTTSLIILGFLLTFLIYFWRTLLVIWIPSFFLLFIFWALLGITHLINELKSSTQISENAIEFVEQNKKFVVRYIESVLEIFFIFFLSYLALAILTIIIGIVLLSEGLITPFQFIFTLIFSISLAIFVYNFKNKEKMGSILYEAIDILYEAIDIITKKDKRKEYKKLSKEKPIRNFIFLMLVLTLLVITSLIMGLWLNINTYASYLVEIIILSGFMFIFVILFASYFNIQRVAAQISTELLELKNLRDQIIYTKITASNAIKKYKQIPKYNIIIDNSLILINFYRIVPKYETE